MFYFSDIQFGFLASLLVERVQNLLMLFCCLKTRTHTNVYPVYLLAPSLT